VIFAKLFKKSSASKDYWFISGILFSLASVVILVVLPYAISRYLASRSARKEFEVIGKQMGLNEEEIALLYKCASTLGEDVNFW
jgi:hypothetical protein